MKLGHRVSAEDSAHNKKKLLLCVNRFRHLTYLAYATLLVLLAIVAKRCRFSAQPFEERSQTTDLSDEGMGAVLVQLVQDKKERPV